MSIEPNDRDQELAAALSELEPPELPPDFYERLRAALVAERDGRGMHERTPDLRRRGVRGGRFALLAGSAGAVAAAAAAVVVLALPERSPLAPEPASAAVVKEQVAAAFASIQTLRGTLVLDGVLGDERVESRARFIVTAAGDVRMTLWTGGARIESAYDSAGGVRRELEVYSDGGASARVVTDVAPGPPDDQGGAETLLRRDLGAYVEALLASADPAVREGEYAGRPAWLVELPYQAPVCRPASESCDVDVSHFPDRLAVTVDQATGILVRVVASREGEVMQEIRLDEFVVDEPVTKDDLELRFPAGADVVRQDESFRRVALGKVAAIVGYTPLLPSWLPDGFELAEVAAVPAGHGARLTNRTNPESTRVVALVYRRGLERIVVTTRARGGVDAVWSDPFAPKVTPAEDFEWQTRKLTLAHGALSGAAAELVGDPRTIAHVWAVGESLVVTVAGDADGDTLVRIAESLGEKEKRS